VALRSSISRLSASTSLRHGSIPDPWPNLIPVVTTGVGCARAIADTTAEVGVQADGDDGLKSKSEAIV